MTCDRTYRAIYGARAHLRSKSIAIASNCSKKCKKTINYRVFMKNLLIFIKKYDKI